jgi:hypothetical protein
VHRQWRVTFTAVIDNHIGAAAFAGSLSPVGILLRSWYRAPHLVAASSDISNGVREARLNLS